MNNSLTRRHFVKTTALATGTLVGGAAMVSCHGKPTGNRQPCETFSPFQGGNYRPADGVAGLLFSQIGYETGFPVRIVVRLPKKDLLPDDAICRLLPVSSGPEHQTTCNYWGEIWKSHWWIAEFTGLNEPGEWKVEVHSNGKCVFRDSGLRVAKNILWDKTLELTAADMLERRVHFTKVGAGWQDAGTLWVESPAQSAMIIALSEACGTKPGPFDKQLKDRIYAQMMVGS